MNSEERKRLEELVQMYEHTTLYDFERKAMNGTPEMQVRLAEYCERASESYPSIEALRWYAEAASANYLPAIEMLAYTKSSYHNRWEYVLKAAELGSATHNLEVVEYYLQSALQTGCGDLGRGAEEMRRQVYNEALPYLERAAELGNVKACLKLCDFYRYGWGGKEDFQKVEFYRDRAQKLGHKF